MQSGFEVNLQGVRERIEQAARRAGRDPDEIKLVAVSKTHSVTAIRQAISAGIEIFGENKVQEAETKIEELGRDAAEWRLIGHLQSNKARKAVELFDVIESLDSVDLAKRLERICIEAGRSELPVFVEVDLAGEATKTGIAEGRLHELVRILTHCVCLRLDGLMVLPPFSEDPEGTRPYFRRLREIRDKLLADGAFGSGAGELSMGMSHDFEAAIEEGSTVVRIGTAIFGSREPA
jgi:PLP dependent protein